MIFTRKAKVLSLYDITGRMVEPWAEMGHKCTIVDIEPTRKTLKSIRSIQADILRWNPHEKYDIVFGFPPCTDLAASGARWWDEKADIDPNFQQKALRHFDRVFTIAKQVMASIVMVENPVGAITRFRRPPNYTFHPWEYSHLYYRDAYQKRTCLWTNETFVMPPGRKHQPDLSDKIHKYGPSSERAFLRSVTPGGFAIGVFCYNAPISEVKKFRNGPVQRMRDRWKQQDF